MSVVHVLIIVAAFLATSAVPSMAGAQTAVPAADREPLSFRIFLNDGTNVATYGEYVRIGEDVVFSTPLGSSRPPRLQLITLPATSVNWPRTERYAESARFLRYASTRGEVDFAVLSAEVSATLNQIADTTDRAQALTIAEQARRTLMAWPAAHYGYRQNDVREIVAMIDEAIAEMRSQQGFGALQLSLVAMPPAAPIETMLPSATPREQVQRLMALTAHASRSADRIAMLRAALTVLDEPASGIDADAASETRSVVESRIRDEESTDATYASLAARLTTTARNAAKQAQVIRVQRALDELEREDVRLGSKRPDVLRSLRSELDQQLEAARVLRLRRDQWQLRRHIYRGYVDSVSVPVSRLVRARPAFEQIRSLAGPAPARLASLIRTLSGGATRLEKMVVPEQMRPAHDQLIAAWQFAESALDARQRAIESGELDTAWQASSAAAGAIMMLAAAQEEMRQVLQFPQLQ